MPVAWMLLLIASIFEIGWAVGLKYTAGFTRLVPSVLVIGGITLSFILLARAARTIPIGTAYGIFVGIGAAGTGILGMVIFAESAEPQRLASLAAIVLGVIGLKLFGGEAPGKPAGKE